MNKDNNAPMGTPENEETQLIPLLRLCWGLFLANWGWFVLSAVICLGLAYVYQQKQPRVYQRQAVMLIEDSNPVSGTSSSRSRRGTNSLNSLLELNGISVGDNLKNEIFILTSHRIMARVVDSLQLDVDYTMRSGLHDVALYRERPFEVTFGASARTPQSFKVKINDNKTFTLSDFTYFDDNSEEVKDNTTLDLRPNETKRTPIGTLRITANADINEFPTEKEITVSHLPKKLAVNIYSKEISATEYDKESSLIIVSCNDVNAGRAEDIVRTVYDAYKQDVVDNKNRVAYNTARFIDERIRLIGEDLSGVETRMAQFKRSNQLIDFQTNAQAYIAESTTARQQSLQLETQVAVAKYLTEFLQNNSNNHETVPLLAMEGASFATLINDYNMTMIERNRMVDNSSENSPAVRDIDRQLASMRSALLSSINSYKNTIELQLQKARGNEAALSGKMGTVPEKEKQGLDIQRQQALKSDLYVYLLNKREEVALQMAISEANVRMVEEPLGPVAPVSPRSSIIILVGLIIGLLIPSIVLWLRHMLDVTISGRRDIEEATSIPIVGEIPRWEDAKNKNTLISETAPEAPITEAFRMLRYSLNFMRHSAKVFIVTSATPGQGKSFVSSNLAYILGMTGKRVLLIDADIRRRTATKQYGNTEGLTGLLSEEAGHVDLDKAIIKNAISEHVDFLPAGNVPPNPSELLISDRLDEVVEAARATYSYVVIDTTPTLSVADADIANRVADITIFMMRVGVQYRSFLPDLEAMYRAKKYRNLCIAINDADSKRGYSYSYGYGYGKPKKKKNGFPFFKRS